MDKKYLILDCFVDEPACFGVPPFISPYPRYISGALLDAGVTPENITYITIDHLRATEYRINSGYDTVFLIGGSSVPGKYLGEKIGSKAEIEKIVSVNINLKFAIGGVIRSVLSAHSGNIIRINCDIEKFAFHHARGDFIDSLRSSEEIARWASLGADIVKQHPDFPDIICEIESGRGCPREKHCSFCSEGLFPNIEFRETPDILSEIDTLIVSGVSRFRIGRQADILQYKTSMSDFKNGFPRPNKAAVINLFNELKKRKVSGHITTLNIDNANPGTISSFPGESEEILEAIAGAVTPGDTIPLGIESFDPEVIAANSLKIMPEDAFKVIETINRIGGPRVDGIPVLLPGVNLIHGLRGESSSTFEKNFAMLERIKNAGLLIKRINIRKLQPFPGTELGSEKQRTNQAVEKRFEYYRDRIRDEIDFHMLSKIYPAGTILKKCLVHTSDSAYSYAKQIASYSITVKVPLKLELRSFHDLLVVGHRERSIIGLTMPLRINSMPQKALEMIPGISKKRSSDIVLKRPFSGTEEMNRFLVDTERSIRQWFIAD